MLKILVSLRIACTCLVNVVLVPGVIFVVDSNDRERVSEAQDELFKMLQEDELRDAVVLVLANKQVRVSAEGHSCGLIVCSVTQHSAGKIEILFF